MVADASTNFAPKDPLHAKAIPQGKLNYTLKARAGLLSEEPHKEPGSLCRTWVVHIHRIEYSASGPKSLIGTIHLGLWATTNTC